MPEFLSWQTTQMVIGLTLITAIALWLGDR
jgi:preprotein translocase subunit SecE